MKLSPVFWPIVKKPRNADAQRPLKTRHLRNSREGVGFRRRVRSADSPLRHERTGTGSSHLHSTNGHSARNGGDTGLAMLVIQGMDNKIAPRKSRRCRHGVQQMSDNTGDIPIPVEPSKPWRVVW